MPGQAVVSIKDKQWSVSVASTYAELVIGLGGVESIPAGTGMLFDLGSDHSFIQIDMTRILFPLDIIFINSTRGVVGVLRNVQPGETDVRFEAITTPGARCFLEVNAGEAEGIEYGDDVVIQGLAQAAQLDISSLTNFMLIAVVLVMMMKVASRALEAPEEQPLLYGPKGERLLPQTRPELAQKWYEKGVEAGRTDGWMDVENTIRETAQAHPEIKEAHELVGTDIDLWEQTDHFNILYGSKMWEDAEGDTDLYLDLKSEFWEGYLAGRREIGKDIYRIARELVKAPTTEFLPQTAGKRGEVLYRVNLASPKHIEEVVLEDGTAVLWRHGKPIVRFRPTEEQRRRIAGRRGLLCILSKQVVEQYEYLPQVPEEPPPGYAEWKAKLEAGYGQYRPGVSEEQVEQEAKSIPKDILRYYFSEKIGFLPLTYQQIARFRKETGRSPRGIMPHLPEEARGDFLFVEYIRDLVKLGEVISDEEARVMWEAWKKRYEKEYQAQIVERKGKFKPGEIVKYKGERVRVLEHIGDRVSIFIPSRQEEVWVQPAKLERIDESGEPKVIPTEPRPPRPRRESNLEYLADSPEFLTQTIDAIGYRDRLDTTFQEAIARAKGLLDIYKGLKELQ